MRLVKCPKVMENSDLNSDFCTIPGDCYMWFPTERLVSSSNDPLPSLPSMLKTHTKLDLVIFRLLVSTAFNIILSPFMNSIICKVYYNNLHFLNERLNIPL